LRFYEAVLEEAGSSATSPVKRVLLGWFYSAMELEDGRSSLCSSPSVGRESIPPFSREPSSLVGLDPRELLPLLLSPYPGERVLGMLAAGCLLAGSGDPCDPEELFGSLRGSKVALLGFEPFLGERISRFASELKVFDDEAVPRRGFLPEWSWRSLGPGFDAIVVSDLSLLKGWMSDLSPSALPPQAKLLFVGSGLPMGFSGYGALGAQAVASLRPQDLEGVFSCVAEGKGLRALERFAAWEISKVAGGG